MAPKTTTNAAKLDACVQWIMNSATAHTLKDLEKALPPVASINSMAVKDYVQAMTDENFIKVEKIGSGNWYWSFPSDVKLVKEQALSLAQTEYDQAAKTTKDLQRKIDEATAERAEDDDSDVEGGSSREALMKQHSVLEKELENSRKELKTFKDNDPVEMELKRRNMEQRKQEAIDSTDQILCMEGWIKTHAGGDKDSLTSMRLQLYDQEYDATEGSLREL